MPFFSAVRGALGAAGGRASRFGMRTAFTGGARGALGLGAAGVGDALRYGSRMSNVGLSSVMGGVGGGLYGAASDDTSVLGGALMGAGLGALGGVAYNRAPYMAGYYKSLRGAGFGRGVAMKNVAQREAHASRRFIGNTYTRAANGFKGLFSYGVPV